MTGLQLSLAIAVFAAVQWALKIWIEERLKGSVKVEVDKRVDEAKQQLQFEYQTKLQDFTLYAAKKHKVNSKAYRLARTAYHAINREMFALKRGEALGLLSAEELDNYLAATGVPLDERKMVATRLSADPQQGMGHLIHTIEFYRIGAAEQKLVDAMEYVYCNELYFSNSVVEGFDAVFSALREVLADGRPGAIIHPKMHEVPRSLAEIKHAMKVDLLGIEGTMPEAAIIREEDPNPPRLSGIPRTVPLPTPPSSAEVQHLSTAAGAERG
jgi:hypothetical protein